MDVKVSNRLKSHPVCLVSDQGVSFEMEKVLNAMPDGQDVKAGRILEINPNHDIFKAIQNVYQIMQIRSMIMLHCYSIKHY